VVRLVVPRGQLEINLTVLKDNISAILKRVNPSKICAVVKADAYGHGTVEISKAAINAGAKCLAVACVEEGLELRSNLIKNPILLLSQPEISEIKEALSWGLIPTLYRKQDLKHFEKYCHFWQKALNPKQKTSKVPIHIKVDTGMHRLGVNLSDLPDLIQELSYSKCLEITGFWTHFACAEDLDNPLTEQQLRTFKKAKTFLTDSSKILLHAANTAAAIRSKKFHLDMVRVGLGIYGFYPTRKLKGQFNFSLTPISNLTSHVCHLLPVSAGEGISYGHSYKLNKDATIAVVPLGYADGIPRRLSQIGGRVLINQKSYPVAGAVTMDYTMIDLGNDSSVKLGDKVYFTHRDNSIVSFEFWAEKQKAIVYEMLTGIGKRVVRVYD
jgi:alanine racemase